MHLYRVFCLKLIANMLTALPRKKNLTSVFCLKSTYSIHFKFSVFLLKHSKVKAEVLLWGPVAVYPQYEY